MADNNEEQRIPYVEFADNANERTPCVLVLDCSGSMRGEPIKQLNAGLAALEKELKEDIDASSRVQLLIIQASGKDEVKVISEWTDAMNFTAPVMEAGGLTPLGMAMEKALKKIEEQKTVSKSFFAKGDRVFHEKLGIGSILDVIEMGESTMYSIDFGKMGKKAMDANYANLKKF